MGSLWSVSCANDRFYVCFFFFSMAFKFCFYVCMMFLKMYKKLLRLVLSSRALFRIWAGKGYFINFGSAGREEGGGGEYEKAYLK